MEGDGLSQIGVVHFLVGAEKKNEIFPLRCLVIRPRGEGIAFGKSLYVYQPTITLNNSYPNNVLRLMSSGMLHRTMRVDFYVIACFIHHCTATENGGLHRALRTSQLSRCTDYGTG